MRHGLIFPQYLEFSQIVQYLTKQHVLKTAGKVKILKSPSRLELMTYIFGVNPLTHCATLLIGDNFGKKTIYKITLDIVYGFFMKCFDNFIHFIRIFWRT